VNRPLRRIVVVAEVGIVENKTAFFDPFDNAIPFPPQSGRVIIPG
jgi:hypothetical protein